MKKFAFVLLWVAVVASFAFATDFSKDPVVGFWMSVDDDGTTPTGYWELFLQNDLLFGKMIYAIGQPTDSLLTECQSEPYKTHPYQGDLSKKTLIDTVLMWNMKFKKEGIWEKGHIIDPENGKMYFVKVTLKGDKLIMKGSIDKAGVLGRSQTWVKSTQEAALKAKANLE